MSASDIAFTPAVKAAQEHFGSRRGYARMEQKRGWKDRITADLAAFLAARDSIYLATATAAGRPYIQHRGGPPGFLRILDDQTLALADFSGNRQYISYGNLSENDQAFIFAMDYANQQRIKIWGRARTVDDDTALLERLIDPGYPAKPERAILFHVEAWDVNCPQHIPRRYAEDEVVAALAAKDQRIDALEAEVAALRQQIDR